MRILFNRIIQFEIQNFQCKFLIISGLLSLCSCFPPLEEDLKTINYSLSDPIVRQIFNARDERNSDSLKVYFHHKKASYRYLAALSFASFRDSSSLPEIHQMLTDPVEEVKQAVVYALGQIGHPSSEKHLIENFLAVDSIGSFNKTNSLILEALGKCGSDSSLTYICNVSSYTANDTLLVYGQMLAIFHFGLRNKFCENSIKRLIEVVSNTDYSPPCRLMAAHCLQRFNQLPVQSYFEQLKRLTSIEKNADVRMCLVTALARCTGTATVSALEELYTRGLDIRIQSNLLKSLSQHNNGQALQFALKAVLNPSLMVSVPAAQYLISNGNEEIFEDIKFLCEQKSMPWQVKSILYQAALKHVPYYMVLTKGELVYKTKNMISQAKNPYEKAAYIKVLASLTKELYTLLNYTSTNQHPQVKTVLAESIETIMNRNDFEKIFPGQKNVIYPALAKYFIQQCNEADAGTLTVMASIFQKPRPQLEKLFKADSMLLQARQKLKLPSEIETYNELSSCIAKLNKTNFIPIKPAYNHPIDWIQFEGHRDTVLAKIISSKGDVELELYPALAPGTVANFIKLSNEGFYNEKVFHRVVPNFVVQGGCPRGDGYGALDFSLRTEISFLNYQESGIIGMASAGSDTESTQFFLTLSPAPHLDGKYTAFGKIISGQDVVQRLSQGDGIIKIEIIAKI